jgi:hypothetical protein
MPRHQVRSRSRASASSMRNGTTPVGRIGRSLSCGGRCNGVRHAAQVVPSMPASKTTTPLQVGQARSSRIGVNFRRFSGLSRRYGTRKNDAARVASAAGSGTTVLHERHITCSFDGRHVAAPPHASHR